MMRFHCRNVIIAFVLMAVTVKAGDEPAAFDVRLLIPRVDGTPKIEFSQRQTFELKNVTNRKLKFWHPESQAGSGQFRVHFTNTRTGEVTIAQRKIFVSDEH